MMLCLEDDASDNDWMEEEADQIGDELAGLLGATSLEL